MADGFTAPDNLLPRRYQEEIFIRARESNIVAALDTGSGKTFISTLLIKWASSQKANQGKAIIFLVPKVTLVEQQGEFIATQTPLRVSKLHGSVQIDLADRARWRKEFEGHDVLVMTAQIFLNVITHSHWSIDKVSLLIFDECHHAQKNHPYNGIMREYLRLSQNLRPKVFGMTASPIWNPKDAKGSLATLERNLDATVIGVRDHVNELSVHSPKPTEVIKEYPPSPDTYDYPSPTLWDCLGIFGLPPDEDCPLSRIHTRYQVTYYNLGPYSAELFLYTYLKHRIAQLKTQPNPDIENQITLMEVNEDVDSTNSLSLNLLEAEEILSNYVPFFEDPINAAAIPTAVPLLSWCSPKIAVLVEILASQRLPFQGIIFVEQRQVAACLAQILPCFPQLEDRIRCAQLVGHASTVTGASAIGAEAGGMAVSLQNSVVEKFRRQELNLLIATSVAEEGLDFPHCDVVIRFDPLQHMIGYLQSRGRARNKTSTYVVMVRQGHPDELARWKLFSESEPELKRAYQEREEGEANQDADEYDLDPADLEARERYVVHNTGATLTYDTSVSLLAYLCSLVPRDPFTPLCLPKYTVVGDFISKLSLPSSIPLPPRKLVYVGARKRSKKEARRAAAFSAVKELHKLGVFDDYLLPASSGTKGKGSEDADGRPLENVGGVRDTLNVSVRDPWANGKRMWAHAVHMGKSRSAGIVTGTTLPPVAIVCNGTVVRTRVATRVIFDTDDERKQRQLMQDYMKLGVWFCNTGRFITSLVTAVLAPLTSAGQPDFDAMQRLVDNPLGSYDWSGIGEEHFGRLMVTNDNRWGRSYILTGIRHDLTAMSVPPSGSKEAGYPTYKDYWVQRWTSKRREAHVPVDCPLIEAKVFNKQSSGKYSLTRPDRRNSDSETSSELPVAFIPQGCTRWIEIPEDMYRTFAILPQLLRRMTDIYRARQARFELSLPPVIDNLLVEAFTLPCVLATFSNQRFETIGDSVLKLGVTVHIFNKFPHRHEGQLDILRRNSISNRALLARAREIGLETFLTSEVESVYTWRYTGAAPVDDTDVRAIHFAQRQFPRRSLQDCMEATLGAAFVTGGMSMALRAGEALGLAFGGARPWSVRYGRHPDPSPIPPLFTSLEDVLGYKFHRGELLVEAITHPSFSSAVSPSYQRLEFLGDALIDLVVIKYLYDKFPKATSGQLTWARSRAVCAPALAFVAVQRLGLHRIFLINNVELSIAIGKYVPLLESISAEDIVHKGWKYDPPKAISDVLESLLGAVLVDSAWNFEKAEAVVEGVLSDVLDMLTPTLPKDPVSQLMLWSASSGCRRITFRKSKSNPISKQNNSVAVLVHDIVVAGPMSGANMPVVKGLVAEQASIVLQDPTSENNLQRLCDCGGKNLSSVIPEPEVVADVTTEDDVPNDETEEGFAVLAHTAVLQFEDYNHDAAHRSHITKDDLETDFEEIMALQEEQEVADMLMDGLDAPPEPADSTVSGPSGTDDWLQIANSWLEIFSQSPFSEDV